MRFAEALNLILQLHTFCHFIEPDAHNLLENLDWKLLLSILSWFERQQGIAVASLLGNNLHKHAQGNRVDLKEARVPVMPEMRHAMFGV